MNVAHIKYLWFVCLCIMPYFGSAQLPLKNGRQAKHKYDKAPKIKSYKPKKRNNMPIDTASKDSVYVANIIIKGNKITQDKIILRELRFKKGDKIRVIELDKILTEVTNNIYNTSLFVTVNVNYNPIAKDTIKVDIDLLERWYVWPVPILELNDNNINQWISRYGANLNRVNYGLKLNWNNFIGRKQKVFLILQLGFLKKIALEYSIPFLDKKQVWGSSFQFSYQESNNVGYTNRDNFINFLEDSSQVIQNRYVQFSLNKRSRFYINQGLRLGYYYNKVRDTVLVLNSAFFKNGDQNTQRYLKISYDFVYDYRDIQAFPTKGLYFSFNFEKLGLNIFKDVDILKTRIRFAHYLSFTKRLIFNYSFLFYNNFGRAIPFNLRRGLGYSNANIVAAYDLNNIEAYHYGVFKTNLFFKLFGTTFNLRPIKILPKHFSTLPFAIYLKTYLNFGYGYHPDPDISNLNSINKPLLGAGFGLDFVTYYDFVLRLEYSFNKIGNNALYFYIKYNF